MGASQTAILDLIWKLVAVLALPVLLIVAAWGAMRRRRPRSGDPFPDIPDASPSAEPIEARGMTYPYSSLDPWAPPKQPASWAPSDDVERRSKERDRR